MKKLAVKTYQRLVQQAEKFRRQHLTEADSQQLCEQGYIYFENEKAIGACMEIKPRRFEPQTYFVNLKGDVFITFGGNAKNGAKDVMCIHRVGE